MWLRTRRFYSVLGEALGRASLVVPLMPIQLQPGPGVDCGLGEASSSGGGGSSGGGSSAAGGGGSGWPGEARAGGTEATRQALEQCLTAVRS